MSEWVTLTNSYTGWTLDEVKELTKRERKNWLEVLKLR